MGEITKKKILTQKAHTGYTVYLLNWHACNCTLKLYVSFCLLCFST